MIVSPHILINNISKKNHNQFLDVNYHLVYYVYFLNCKVGLHILISYLYLILTHEMYS